MNKHDNHSLILFLLLFFIFVEEVDAQAKIIRIKQGKPFEQQLIQSNATYRISNVVDLRGETVSLPEGIILRFKKKGALVNGGITGDRTRLSGRPKFDNIRIKGTFVNKEFYSSWCSPNSISSYIEDIMNLSAETSLIVDTDLYMNNQKRTVSHLTLKGKGNTIFNSDSYDIKYGGCYISDLCFSWPYKSKKEPGDYLDAVVLYTSLLQKDTTVLVEFSNIVADGGWSKSFFMNQSLSKPDKKLRTINNITDCSFSHFNRGVILTCAGSGIITNCVFDNVGYDTDEKLLSVVALRLGLNNDNKSNLVNGYTINGCVFSNIVSPQSGQHNARELHAILGYGDMIVVNNCTFSHLSSSFDELKDPNYDAEMIYIKGSNNLIENNIISGGVGSSSDGVITLKVPDSSNNVVKNNKIVLDQDWGTFILIRGFDNIIEDNEFINKCLSNSDERIIAIYLLHVGETEYREKITINNNIFSFPSNLNFTAIFANKWGDLQVKDNTFINPHKLLSARELRGKCCVSGNSALIDGVIVDPAVVFIDLFQSEQPVDISFNNFDFFNTHMGRLVEGAQYVFSNNTIRVQNSQFTSFLRGGSILLHVSDNQLNVMDERSAMPRSMIGENHSNAMTVDGNIIVGSSMSITK